jgi:hypothetical protein
VSNWLTLRAGGPEEGEGRGVPAADWLLMREADSILKWWWGGDPSWSLFLEEVSLWPPPPPPPPPSSLPGELILNLAGEAGLWLSLLGWGGEGWEREEVVPTVLEEENLPELGGVIGRMEEEEEGFLDLTGVVGVEAGCWGEDLDGDLREGSRC